MAVLIQNKIKSIGAVALMVAVAMISMATVFADDSDAASSSYDIGSCPSDIYPTAGDVITISGVYSVSNTVPGTLDPSSHVLTITVPETCTDTHMQFVLRDSSNGKHWVTLHSGENWPISKLSGYCSANTLYVAPGCSVTYTAIHDDTDETSYYLNYDKILSVTPGCGLTVDSNGNLSGTVTASPGTVIEYVWAEDYDFIDGEDVTHNENTVRLVVAQTVKFTVSDLDAYVGQNVSKTVCTKDITSIDGADWLHFNGGTIYGTAPSVGTYNVTVHSGSSSASFTITVKSALAPTNSPTSGLLVFEI